ncbi:MAG: DUF2281 domain-containing protein [Desulfuromonadaceae bacterium]
MNLQSAVNSLPPEVQIEVFDFVEFLRQKYVTKKLPAKHVREDSEYWTALSMVSVQRIWDNEEDDIYNELLKR